ncbi:hypothetical protein [Embleya sp. NPDC050493]|uniref:hypothetical protein n=1 Tax=Embleya sp. NPDC050493 TaxID=3363989 RepID=UPI0037AC95B3
MQLGVDTIPNPARAAIAIRAPEADPDPDPNPDPGFDPGFRSGFRSRTSKRNIAIPTTTTAVACRIAAQVRSSGIVVSTGLASATYSMSGSFQALQANSEPDPIQPSATGSRRTIRPGRP